MIPQTIAHAMIPQTIPHAMIPQTIPRAMIPQTKSKAEIKKLMGVQPIKYPTVTNLQLEHRRQAKLFMEKCDTCNPKLYYENEEDYKKHLDSHAHKHVLSMTYNRKCEHPDCLMEIWKKLAISKGYSNYKNSQPKQPGEIQIKKPIEIPPRKHVYVNEPRGVTTSHHVDPRNGKETKMRWEPASSSWSAAIAAKNPTVDRYITDGRYNKKMSDSEIRKSITANRPIVIPPKHPKEVVKQPQHLRQDIEKGIDKNGNEYTMNWAEMNRSVRSSKYNTKNQKVVYKPQPTYTKEFAQQNGFAINELGYKIDKYGHKIHEPTVIRKTSKSSNKQTDDQVIMKRIQQQNELERRRLLQQESLKRQQNEMERRRLLQQENLKRQQNELERKRLLQQETKKQTEQELEARRQKRILEEREFQKKRLMQFMGPQSEEKA